MFIDIAAVPVADGRADNYPKEVCQAGKPAGIHGLTLYKTEKFPGGSADSGAAVFRQYTASHVRRESMSGGCSVCHRYLKASIKIRPPEVTSRNQGHGHYDECRTSPDSHNQGICGIIKNRYQEAGAWNTQKKN